MKRNKIISITEVILILLCVYIVIDSYKVSQKYDELMEKKCESNIMYEINETQFSPTGLYFHTGFYCVWTKDRTSEEIANTKEHELCHALIDKDEKQHFCKK